MIVPSFIHTQIPLADKNWFKTGGNAQFFAEPKTAEEFQQALAFAQTYALPVCVLGAGANILIHDNGFDGLVIRPQLQEIIVKREEGGQALVTAGAGVHLDSLIAYCLEKNVLGLEEFSGIPGTVGGSVFINVHYFEFLLEHFLVEAQVIDARSGEIELVDRAWFQFEYDQSALQDGAYYLIEATFSLRTGDAYATAYAQGRRAEIIRHRQRRYPTHGTCGSFFRNFHADEVTESQLVYVAYYLDRVGVKGSLRSGNAGVSHQHANMIVNFGGATSADIIAVAQTMQTLVHDAFSVLPQPECLLIGFPEYPLLRKSDDI